jgi:ATP-dependent protease ClpP protease subunit
MNGRQWYQFKNQASESAELWIYEEIGENFWGEGVAAKTFVPELNALKVSQIDLHINSYGGNVFDGVAIHNALVRHPANVTSYIDGIAASIASIVALAGNDIVMPSNAMLMIHNPAGFAFGDETAMRQMAEALASIKDSMLNVYEEHSSKSRKDLSAAMDSETWLTAQDAIDYGFVTEEAEPLDIAACYRPLPEDLKGRIHVPAAYAQAPRLKPTSPVAETPDGMRERRARAVALLTRL